MMRVPFYVVVFCIISTVGFAKDPHNKVQKIHGTPNTTLFNINNISSWYSDNTEMEHNPFSESSGLTFPRGITTAIYISGLMIGMYSNDGAMPPDQPRVTGTTYNSGFTSGAIIGMRTGVTEDPSATDVRIWRIRKDYSSVDLKRDAAEIHMVPLASVTVDQISAIRNQYEKDWKEWPWQKGAPFYDVGYLNESSIKVGMDNKILDWGEDANQNGVLDPGEDKNTNDLLDAEFPGLADADQVLWYVANDIRIGDSPWKTKPVGLEQQVTIWGYNNSSTMSNIIFKKFKFIYKGTASTPANAQITDFYICHFSDIDLGDPGDDFAGCDTTLDLGFVYNSKSLDAEYKKYELAPPAIGFDLFQGPIVQSPGDTAIFDLKKRPGFKNLPMSAFFAHVSGDAYSDPPFTLNGSWQWYSLFLGLPPTPQPPPFPGPIINPVTGKATKFSFSGNPISGSGWIDGIVDGPGDRRILQTTGPFSMALGDTQEVVFGAVAGIGSDRLASVAAMKYYDKIAQTAFNNLFVTPKPPPAPNAKLVGLDQGIIIEWESDAEAVFATENTQSLGHRFEGYVLYQLPSASSSIKESKRIATFDLLTDPATIVQEKFDEESGQVLVLPVQYGKNSGIKRYVYIKRDEVLNAPLVNGKEYHFAVTAYNYNSDPQLITHSYESEPKILTVIPNKPGAGQIYPYAINDTLTNIALNNITGNNDANVAMVVFNPTVQSGATFDVWYGGKNSERNATIVRNLPGPDYAEVKGILHAKNQIPAINNLPNAIGSGTFTINDPRSEVKYSVSVSGLSGPVTAAHIHPGASGVNGIPVHTINFTGNTAQGTWSIPDSLVDDFTAGNLYVNIHTALNPGGEIRGQISDGIFPRENIPNPAVIPRSLISYKENRVPTEGVAFYLIPAPLGPKSVVDKNTSANVLNNPSADGIYSIKGTLHGMIGSKLFEDDLEIRFQSGDHYAADWGATPAQVKFIKVPFAVYKDTVRVWPVIVNASDDSVWNADEKNPLVNGKKSFDAIYGICDVRNSIDQNINYYSTFYTAMPPTSTSQKSTIINGVNHIASNIRFVSEKNDGTYPAAGTTVRLTMNKAIQIGDIKSFTMQKATGVYRNGTELPTEFSLSQNYPNPFNPSTRIEFSLPHQSQVSLKIFDILGREVVTLLDEERSAGLFFVEWNGKNNFDRQVASGVYFYQISAGSFVESKKMILLK